MSELEEKWKKEAEEKERYVSARNLRDAYIKGYLAAKRSDRDKLADMADQVESLDMRAERAEHRVKLLNDELGASEEVIERAEERVKDLEERDKIQAHANHLGEIIHEQTLARLTLEAEKEEVEKRVKELEEGIRRLIGFILTVREMPSGWGKVVEQASKRIEK